MIERLVAGVQEQAAAKSTALVEAGSKVAHRLADQADVLAEKSAAVVSTAVAKLKRWKGQDDPLGNGDNVWTPLRS